MNKQVTQDDIIYFVMTDRFFGMNKRIVDPSDNRIHGGTLDGIIEKLDYPPRAWGDGDLGDAGLREHQKPRQLGPLSLVLATQLRADRQSSAFSPSWNTIDLLRHRGRA